MHLFKYILIENCLKQVQNVLLLAGLASNVAVNAQKHYILHF